MRRHSRELILLIALAMLFSACAKESPASAVVMPTVITLEARLTGEGSVEIDPTIPAGHMLSVHYEMANGNEVYVNMQERRDNPEAIEVLRLDPKQLIEMSGELYYLGKERDYLGACLLMSGMLHPDPSVEENDYLLFLECTTGGEYDEL